MLESTTEAAKRVNRLCCDDQDRELRVQCNAVGVETRAVQQEVFDGLRDRMCQGQTQTVQRNSECCVVHATAGDGDIYNAGLLPNSRLQKSLFSNGPWK